MALNIADLFEHAVDAFPRPGRGDLRRPARSPTPSSRSEANRLAHHLAAHGVGPGDHVGLYARNRVEADRDAARHRTSCAPLPININYRYSRTSCSTYLRDADVVALVHDRRSGPGRRRRPPGRARLAHRRRDRRRHATSRAGPASAYDRQALPAASPETRLRRAQRRRPLHHLHRRHHRLPEGRDVAPRGHLAHARRRHRLHHRRAAGRRVGAVPQRALDGRAWSACASRRSSTATRRWPRWLACSAATPSCCCPQFDPDEIWRRSQRHKVNVLSSSATRWPGR